MIDYLYIALCFTLEVDRRAKILPLLANEAVKMYIRTESGTDCFLKLRTDWVTDWSGVEEGEKGNAGSDRPALRCYLGGILCAC